jgi:hypothetical protein
MDQGVCRQDRNRTQLVAASRRSDKVVVTLRRLCLDNLHYTMYSRAQFLITEFNMDEYDVIEF